MGIKYTVVEDEASIGTDFFAARPAPLGKQHDLNNARMANAPILTHWQAIALCGRITGLGRRSYLRADGQFIYIPHESELE